jgi:tetratricopeptide (TPR) repeat protein
MIGGRIMRGAVAAMLLAAAAMAGGGIQRAREFYGRAEYRAAIDALLPLQGQSPESLALLGQAYYGNGQYKQATESLEKAVAVDPRNAVYHDWLGRAYGRRAETSSVFTAPFYAIKTREAFEKAVALDPANVEALSDVFEYYLEAPGALGGGVDKAEAIAARIGRLDAAEFECKQAALAEKRKQFAAAEQHLRRAAAMEPDHAGRVIDLAEFLSRRGRHEESDELLRAAEDRNPGSPSLMFARANLEIRRGRNLAKAKALLRSYLASPITPDDPPRAEALRLARIAQ